MCVEILVVLATVRREVCGRFAPSGVGKEQISFEQPALSYLRWDVAVSRPEPDLDAVISRLGHDVIPTTIEVKCRTVGGATVRNEDTTPLVVICRSPAAVADGSSAWVTKQKAEKELERSERARGKDTYPVWGRSGPSGGIAHPGRVCKVAWFCTFKLTPARRHYTREWFGKGDGRSVCLR
jgi:hypothetical protein